MLVLINKSKNRRKLDIFIEVFRMIKCVKTLLLVFCKSCPRKSTTNGFETGVNMINTTGYVKDKLRRKRKDSVNISFKKMN